MARIKKHTPSQLLFRKMSHVQLATQSFLQLGHQYQGAKRSRIENRANSGSLRSPPTAVSRLAGVVFPSSHDFVPCVPESAAHLAICGRGPAELHPAGHGGCRAASFCCRAWCRRGGLSHGSLGR